MKTITTPVQWKSKSTEKITNELIKLIDLSSENDIQLHVGQINKKGTISIKDYFFSSLGTFKKEILQESKKSIYNDLEDMVYRSQLPYDEIIDKFGPK